VGEGAAGEAPGPGPLTVGTGREFLFILPPQPAKIIITTKTHNAKHTLSKRTKTPLKGGCEYYFGKAALLQRKNLSNSTY
jgi:hypothetical protein